jgi:hypothetical protein
MLLLMAALYGDNVELRKNEANFATILFLSLQKTKQESEKQKAHACARAFWVFLVPNVGFELTTYRLQVGCSTN